MSTTLPDWITDPALSVVWARVRDRLEARGLQATGSVSVELPERAQRHAVAGLLGRTVTRSRVTLDLAQLDARLRERSGVGGLVDVLTSLAGAPPQDRLAARAAREAGRDQPLALALSLVDAPWAVDWVAGLRRTGLLTNRPAAERVVTDAARVLRVLTAGGEPAARSRVELAAQLLGDAHALDEDRLVQQVVLRGLAAATGCDVPAGTAQRRELWERYGVGPDLLSRTCLVWGLCPTGEEPAARRLRDAAAAGDPVHLTEWDLRRLPGFGDLTGTTVLVCENPRVLEAVAERATSPWSVVCTSGEPNTVVGAVLGRLVTASATLRYHGDFDWPGLAIANRIVERFGAAPWRMSAAAYLEAVRRDAPALVGSPVEARWDARLGAAMRDAGRAVHEESVLTDLLAALPLDGV